MFLLRGGLMSYAEYSQSTGRFRVLDAHNGVLYEATGYAGRGDGLNNPDADDQRNLGPLPRAVYRIGPPSRHPRLGPTAMRLDKKFGPDFGRSGFYIHGDNKARNQSASSGCIVLDRQHRLAIAKLRPCLLIVER